MLSLGSLFGFLALLGFTVRNSIVMSSQFERLKGQEGESFGAELIVRGASERLAPIVMTALATALALLPFVVFGSIAGLEMVYPIAVVMLGGLVTALVLNLFIMPSLYLRFGASPAAAKESAPVSAQPEFGMAGD
jgi:Cu/Ag efflux pump CusA